MKFTIWLSPLFLSLSGQWSSLKSTLLPPLKSRWINRGWFTRVKCCRMKGHLQNTVSHGLMSVFARLQYFSLYELLRLSGDCFFYYWVIRSFTQPFHSKYWFSQVINRWLLWFVSYISMPQKVRAVIIWAIIAYIYIYIYNIFIDKIRQKYGCVISCILNVIAIAAVFN